jgi:hypothetical protein
VTKSTQSMLKHSFSSITLDEFLVNREIAIAKHLLLDHTCENCEYMDRVRHQNKCGYDKYKARPDMKSMEKYKDFPTECVCINWRKRGN